jgi:myxalamid-type nonribosomal peptide synthetase MxaA
VLGVEFVGIYDNFFNLGGHSMLAVQLMFKVREAFGIEMPLRTFFERPTVERQARLLGGDVSPLEAPAAEPANLEAEAELDFGFAPWSAGKPAAASPSAVLLTGATGFLGAYLLRDLLRATQAKIYCLVRAGSPHEAAARLGRALDRYELRELASNPRVTALCGDLTKPFLGIPPDRFASLSREIGAIYHNGAAVDFTASYETLKPCNVSGTREVLRLAGLGIPKAVHYVSTVSVFGENPPPPSGFTEEDFPPAREKLIGGYAQSKWVAERMVRIAAERGLPVTIHRPSTIFGDSRSGVCNTGDVLCRMIEGCIELGSAPDMDEPLNVVPVDYASAAIVFLSGQPDALGKTFHLTGTETISAKALIDGVREFGYPVEIVPSDRWVRDTTARIKHRSDHVLYPLLPLFEEWQGNGGDSKDAPNRYGCLSTVDALRRGNIGHPCGMEALVRVVLSGLVRRGSIPACGKRDRPNPDLLKTVTVD